MWSDMLFFIACGAGIYLGLHFNILSVLPFSVLGVGTYFCSLWLAGQSAVGNANLLIFFVAVQGGYMLGLTVREPYEQVLARLNISPSKRV
jgi:nitric oxide reductase large subunit